jgi:hypothetical protein
MARHKCTHGQINCDHCLRAVIRRDGLAGVVCAFCERVGHTARYCQGNRIGRARLHGGRALKAEAAR